MNQHNLLRLGWLAVLGFLLIAAGSLLDGFQLRLAVILPCLIWAAWWTLAIMSRLAERSTILADMTAKMREESERRNQLESAARQFLDSLPVLTPFATALAECAERHGELAKQLNAVLEDVSLVQEDLIHVTPSIAAVLNIEGPALQSQISQLAVLAQDNAAKVSSIVEGLRGASAQLERLRQDSSHHLASLRGTAESCLADVEEGRTALAECDKALAAWRSPVDEIGQAVQVATDLAEQARILGVNASIEALRSGEAGRGFLLVAEEAQRLSERMLRVAHQIAAQIEEGEKMAAKAVGSLERALSALGRIKESSRQLADQAHEAEEPGFAFAQEDASELTRLAAQVVAEIGVLGRDLAEAFDRLQLSSAEEARTIAEKLFGEATEAAKQAKELGNMLEGMGENARQFEGRLHTMDSASRRLKQILA